MAEPTRETLARPVQVQFSHAVLQDLASVAGVEVLHIKGPAIDLSLAGGTTAAPTPTRWRGRRIGHRSGDGAARLGRAPQRGGRFTVRPRHHARAPDVGLRRHPPPLPWRHRRPRGRLRPTVGPRTTTTIAEIDCTVPSLGDQRTLLVLNAARGGATLSDDLERLWPLPPTSSAPSCASGRPARGRGRPRRGHRELHLHRRHTQYAVEGPDRGRLRTEERAARMRAEPSAVGKIRITARAPRVDREQLALNLGHQPLAVRTVRGDGGESGPRRPGGARGPDAIRRTPEGSAVSTPHLRRPRRLGAVVTLDASGATMVDLAPLPDGPLSSPTGLRCGDLARGRRRWPTRPRRPRGGPHRRRRCEHRRGRHCVRRRPRHAACWSTSTHSRVISPHRARNRGGCGQR